MSTASTYTAKDITVLEGLEPVRKRPSMYIGGVDGKGLHHLVWEIVDNAVDEYLNGYADAITVTLHKGGDAVTVTDNGRGIPVDMHPKLQEAGAGADPDARCTPAASSARAATTSTPAACTASARRSSTPCRRSSSPPSAATATSGSRPSSAASRPASSRRSARSAATARPSTSSPTRTSSRRRTSTPTLIKAHLEDMSYIHSGLKITLQERGHRGDVRPDASRRHPGVPRPGSSTEGQKPAVTEAPFHLVARQRRQDGGRPAVDRIDRRDRSAPTSTASARRRAARTRTASRAASSRRSATTWRRTRSRSRASTITAEDIREGIVGILSVFVREPMFQGQTKERLNNPEMTATVDNFVRPGLEAWLNANKTAADQIVGRIVLAARARLASREAASEVKRKSADAAPAQPARQARRLQVDRPGRVGAVHRRRRLGRRLGQAGPQQQDPGRAAAARQDPQLRGAGARARCWPTRSWPTWSPPSAPAPARSSTSTACATARSSCSWTPTPTATTSRRCCWRSSSAT